MLNNIVGFYNMAQQAVERTSQSDNKITYSIIKDQLVDCMHQLTRMKFKVNFYAHSEHKEFLHLTGFDCNIESN